jgi:hypothetical protein
MYSRAFEEEEETEAGILDEETAPPAGEEPEYSFEGYDVDFSTKVMLTPFKTAGS